MDKCTSVFVGIVVEHRRRFEEIVLRSNSCAVAFVPSVFELDPIICLLSATILDDYGNVCNSGGNVAMRHENDPVHLALVWHLPR